MEGSPHSFRFFLSTLQTKTQNNFILLERYFRCTFITKCGLNGCESKSVWWHCCVFHTVVLGQLMYVQMQLQFAKCYCLVLFWEYANIPIIPFGNDIFIAIRGPKRFLIQNIDSFILDWMILTFNEYNVDWYIFSEICKLLAIDWMFETDEIFFKCKCEIVTILTNHFH